MFIFEICVKNYGWFALRIIFWKKITAKNIEKFDEDSSVFRGKNGKNWVISFLIQEVLKSDEKLVTHSSDKIQSGGFLFYLE